jgi:hypothetical protein
MEQQSATSGVNFSSSLFPEGCAFKILVTDVGVDVSESAAESNTDLFGVILDAIVDVFGEEFGNFRMQVDLDGGLGTRKRAGPGEADTSWCEETLVHPPVYITVRGQRPRTRVLMGDDKWSRDRVPGTDGTQGSRGIEEELKRQLAAR